MLLHALKIFLLSDQHKDIIFPQEYVTFIKEAFLHQFFLGEKRQKAKFVLSTVAGFLRNGLLRNGSLRNGSLRNGSLRTEYCGQSFCGLRSLFADCGVFLRTVDRLFADNLPTAFCDPAICDSHFVTQN